MKKTIVSVAVLAIMAAIGVSSSQAQNPEEPSKVEVPSKVTGGGVFQHFVVLDPDWQVEWYPSDEEVGEFSISINPDNEGGEESPQAVIHVDGHVLREFWGGPLTIEDDLDSALYFQMAVSQDDPKPSQIFAFIKELPDYGLVRVWVLAHDNVTPGYNEEDANWSDWFGIWIEPLQVLDENGEPMLDENGQPKAGDGQPGTPDDLFTGMGIITSGNIMDHRISEPPKEETPSKMTGWGVYQHFVVLDPDWQVEWYPSDEEVGQFSISINPENEGGGKSPQAVIHVDGPALREVWGGPLTIKDDLDSTLYYQMVFLEGDPKPSQVFAFIKAHPDYGLVRVWVYMHDNVTPGYNAEDADWSDWFGIWIEPLLVVDENGEPVLDENGLPKAGDGQPGTEDDLFTGMGIVTSGNIMDHRQEENDYVPFKVTGEGVYQHFVYLDPDWQVEWYPSDEEVGLFSISINPDEKSPQAVIRVDGIALREIWGGPLLIQDDWVACMPELPYRPEDVKPGQVFMFYTHHPILGDVQVGVLVHDNCTPGYNPEDTVWSDWFALVIEPLGGDGLPGTEDDLFTSMGIVTSGNIMDYRQFVGY